MNENTENVVTENAASEISEEAPKAFAVGDIRLQLGDKYFVFAPTDDITPKEVALIFQMFLNGIMQKNNGYIDFGTYLKTHNLERQFSEMVQENSEKE